MKLNIKYLNSTKNLLGYYEVVKKFKKDDLKFETIFPVRKINGLEFSYIKGSKDKLVTLSPSAFDTEAIIRDRGNLNYSDGELALFKNKMSLTESNRQALFQFLNASNNNAVNIKMSEIFDGEINLLESALVTQEYLRARALADGVITMDYDGGKVDVNYGYDSDNNSPNQNKYDISTSDTEKWSNPRVSILKDLINWKDSRTENTNVTPDTLWLSSKTFRLLAKNEEIKDVIGMSGRNISEKNLKQFIKENTGLTVKTYDKKLEVNGEKKDMIDYGRVILTSQNIGNLLVGTTPLELDKAQVSNIADITITGDGIAVSKWASIDPIQLFTGVEMVCLPSFPGIDYCVSAKVV